MAPPSDLQSKDLVVLLVMAHWAEPNWTYEELGDTLQMSPSQVYYSIERLDYAQLYDKRNRLICRQELIEFLIHGVRYAFAAQPGELTRGMPTAISSTVGHDLFVSSGADPDYVWPTPKGDVRGQSVDPLYDRLPDMLLNAYHPYVYDMLALIDIMRIGSAREREVAAEEISDRLTP